MIKELLDRFLDKKTETLWHPDSPGGKVKVTRIRFGRVFKHPKFATLTEVIRAHKSGTR